MEILDNGLQNLFLEDTNETEVIAKFHGDIAPIAQDLGAEIEILSQGYAIITIDKDKILNLYFYPEIEHLELPKSLYIASPYNLASSCIPQVQDRETYNLSGAGVIVAIIDSGIDYTHPDFRNEDGTSRILYLWDQTGKGNPPAGFTSGAEYTQAQLNEALSSPNPLRVISCQDPNGHGTAVAGIAAGNGRGSDGQNMGVATEAMLIVVEVGMKGYKAFARTTELMRAVKYVIDTARNLNRPVVINMSFGMNNGSHRGDTLFETYLTDISNEWKTSMVIPTGNEGAAGHHYRGQISSNQIKEIDFFTAPGIEEYYISFWKDFTDSFSVEIIFPNGESSGVVSISNQVKSVRVDNLVLTVIYGQPSHYSISQEIFFQVRATTGTIKAGAWKLRIISGRVVDGNFRMWLPTLEQVTDKTYFSNPTSEDTLTIPSTANKMIAVAGYNDRVGNIAEFSGKGNTNMALPNPDLAAPAVAIMSTRVGGGYDSFTGTSMAAPFVTGSVALMMQWGIINNNDPFLYGERVRAFLRLGANRQPNTTYPNPSFGYGTLCLSNTMAFLERYRWGKNNLWL
ncbi:MAG TPA: S8 family peptidase [Oscillospiraceae bacterium]|nr:S8 family peptidase [Oscillospiraceae bacterium]